MEANIYTGLLSHSNSENQNYSLLRGNCIKYYFIIIIFIV